MALHHNRKKAFRFWMVFFLMALFSLPLFLSTYIASPDRKAVFQSKAQIASGSIQQMIDAAKDGATITIPAGTYSGPTALPLGLGGNIAVSDSRGASETCFIRIENKQNLTIKGQGATIFGEGHDKPYMDPYQHRAGICVINSKVTFDGLHVKEFQKRCMVVYNSTIVYKNGVVDGCDEGGISMLGNSAGLIVNNMICCHNFGGVMLWQNSQVKIVNNILHGANVMFFYHPNTNDQAKAEIINNIFTGGSHINQVDWWKTEAGSLKTNKVSYNLDSGEQSCDPSLMICDYPGKIAGDPLYVEPVTDPRGIAAWANFGFKEGSPAVGVGDPSIPGTKTLGNAGGPCVDPNSSVCSSFIQGNIPAAYAPSVPTEAPVQEQVPDDSTLPDTGGNEEPIGGLPTTGESGNKEHYTTNEVGPMPSPIYNNVFSKEQAVLYVTSIGSNKTIRILALFLQNANQGFQAELPSGKSIKYSFSALCKGLALKATGALVYASSEDNFEKIRYKNIELDCYKAQIIEIE